MDAWMAVFPGSQGRWRFTASTLEFGRLDGLDTTSYHGLSCGLEA